MNEENKKEGKCCSGDNKVKNLISLSIILAGLFVGSLFVDLSQLVRGGGISQKILNDKDIFQLEDKTWVAYSDPIVDVSIINDSECKECQVDEALVWLKKIVPTMLTNAVEYNSEEGKKMLEDYGVKSLPAFVFSKEIKDTEFYAQAEQLFTEKNGNYILDTAQLGLPAGKYVTLPTINDNTIKVGSDDAKVRLVEFSDFQCPYCQMFHESIDTVVKEYGDKVQFVFKQLPLESIHPRAMVAAIAGECANEQGKFLEYAGKLFDGQKVWSKTENNNTFNQYARQLGLNSKDFNSCLESDKYADKIKADTAEARDFGISGTPAIFVNDQFKSGAVQLADLKALIDAELAK